MLQVVFQQHNQGQACLFPMSLDEKIPLSSANDAQTGSFCLSEQHLFLPQNRKTQS